MIRRFDLAPLDGITKRVFREVWHKRFGGVDRYFIPFISPTDQHVITPGIAGSWRTPRVSPRSPR